MKYIQYILFIALGVAVVVIGLFLYSQHQKNNILDTPAQNITTLSEPNSQQQTIQIVAENLTIPWEVRLLPTGEILVTERTGNLVIIGTDTQVITVAGVSHIGEGGLLGLALHPEFERNSYLYLYMTYEESGKTLNKVERYSLQNATLSKPVRILDGIQGSSVHDGGRIAFGPNGYLYITTGDAGQPDLSQDTQSLNGKILRIKDDGSIPEDNPFGNAVYSYGHRNAQGIAWNEEGQLWATEHGRSGIRSGFDEINLIQKGGNYGWPVIQGDETQPGMITPVIHSGPTTTWAPAGAAFLQNRLFFTGLRGKTLYEATIEQSQITSLKEHLRGEYGRLRAAALAPDGNLYITTSNRDGRGETSKGDDKLIKINIEKL